MRKLKDPIELRGIRTYAGLKASKNVMCKREIRSVWGVDENCESCVGFGCESVDQIGVRSRAEGEDD